MYEYKIKLEAGLGESLNKAAAEKGVTAESLIVEILNRYLVPAHTINQEEMAEAYAEMGAINLELAK